MLSGNAYSSNSVRHFPQQLFKQNESDKGTCLPRIQIIPDNYKKH